MKDDETKIFCILREEYYGLLPKIEILNKKFTLEIQCTLKEMIVNLNPYQRIEVVSRIKECESAIRALQRREEGALFDQKKENRITSLPDLVGVRVLYFPCDLKDEIQDLLNQKFPDWTSDPIKYAKDNEIPKFYGQIENGAITAEYQIVPMLIGAFWDVEHSLYYKPHPKYKSIKKNLSVRETYNKAMKALTDFEIELEGYFKKEN